MALNKFCKGTRVGGIELVLDLNLKENVKREVCASGFGVFFAFFVLSLLTVPLN